MYSIMVRTFTIAACIISVVSVASAQQRGSGGQQFDVGKIEYNGHCAACHGLTGDGQGPVSNSLNKAVPNLKFLAKQNGGVFPFARTYEIIDGTQVMLTHGTKEMPVWGPRYKVEAGESSYDDFRSNAEVFVRARILALTEYVYRLQAK